MGESEQANRNCLATFTAAWGRGDIDGCVSCFAAHGVYAASVGPQPGATFSGRDEIRAGIREMLRHDAGARMVADTPRFLGDQAVVTWTYWKRDRNTQRAVRGCDIFTFWRGQILKKDAFRKTEAG